MAGAAERKLPPDAFKKALVAVADWQRAPAEPVACPVCGIAGLAIVDHSARPYTAWFGLDCPSCGLADTITYPLGDGGSWS